MQLLLHPFPNEHRFRYSAISRDTPDRGAFVWCQGNTDTVRHLSDAMTSSDVSLRDGLNEHTEGLVDRRIIVSAGVGVSVPYLPARRISIIHIGVQLCRPSLETARLQLTESREILEKAIRPTRVPSGVFHSL